MCYLGEKVFTQIEHNKTVVIAVPVVEREKVELVETQVKNGRSACDKVHCANSV